MFRQMGRVFFFTTEQEASKVAGTEPISIT